MTEVQAAELIQVLKAIDSQLWWVAFTMWCGALYIGLMSGFK